MGRPSKRFRQVSNLVDKSRAYPPQEALELAKKTATARFDETVELHIRTGADPRHADQLVRGVVVLPHGTGKKIRVLVFAQGEAADTARQAGADYVGGEDLIKKIEGGWLDFEVSMATPEMMSKVGRLGRILGRRGLMPNPRSGTVVAPEDLPRVITEAKRGRLEFRMDRTGLIHVPLGKVSFETPKLLENLATFMNTLLKAKPSAIKGQFIRSLYLATSMGPSIKLDLPATLSLRAEVL